jgi:acetylornithine/N-succinyldiaminopimelate aminotransferase
MDSQTIIDKDKAYVMHTYARQPICALRASGATFYDVDGTEYIDFAGGIGVNALGSGDAKWIEAVTAQLKKIAHTSNYYYAEPVVALAEKLVNIAGMRRAFFCNSGAEANEGALKLARKYSCDKYGGGRSAVITLKDSFHGRTLAALTMTGQDAFHRYFHPFAEGVRYAPANDIGAMQALMGEDVCAVFIEPIQGEGGVHVLNTDYARALESLCAEKDILLVCDEVQCGTGRTGRFFAYEYLGIKPDIVTVAKGIGGGLPLGVILGGEKCADVFSFGDHGSTFGGNVAVCAGACEVTDRIANEDFLAEVRKKGAYLMDKLKALKSGKIVEVRGRGLMIGIQVTGDVKNYINKAQENGLLIIGAGKDALRLLPPLVISYDEIDKGVAVLEKIL